MNISQNIKNILINNNVDINSIDNNTMLVSAGILDSITFVNILLEIEEYFNIEIDFEDEDFNNLTTIEGLTNTVSSLLSEHE